MILPLIRITVLVAETHIEGETPLQEETPLEETLLEERKEREREREMTSKIAGLYDMEDTLGSGHFAVVKSARHVFTGE